MSRIINGDIELPKAPEAEDKQRLDMALLEKYPGYNRSTLQKYIKNGQVKVNGEIIEKANTLVSESDELDLLERAMPERPEVAVIYEDENVLVLDKPEGILSISKGDFNPEPTMEEFGIIVHRLDRDTSGVMIVAKNEETHSMLQRQFQERKTHKTYNAVVVGHPDLPEAIIDVPLARNMNRPTTFVPDAEGREAITQYKVLDRSNKYSLLQLKPQTGRTHQLRVHMKHLGTPILGDPIYGDTPAKRMYLHASELEITIPGGIRKTFKSELPREFNDVLRED
ncbi:MAG: RluA family pseudouridine synthase [Candidatus Saccharimonadales bacterium]